MSCHGFAIVVHRRGGRSGRQQEEGRVAVTNIGTTTTTGTSTASRHFLFDGLFGSDSNKNENEHDELAIYSNLPSEQFDGLAEYIQQWAMLFDKDKGGGGMGLTTPVTVRPIDKNNNDNNGMAKGVQIVFSKVQTGYRDKDKEKDKDKDEASKEPEKEVKQGGVEILVEKVGDDAVQVRAGRCEMEEDTMIKEMSEQTILKELKKAMDVWKKQQHP